MNIDIQIEELIVIDNQVITGQLDSAYFKMEFNPFISSGNIDRISIKWTINMNIISSEYALHQSSTNFTCPNLPFDENILNDMRIELISELGQISQSHSRALFVNLNNSEEIPMFTWRLNLKEEIVSVIKAKLN